MAIIDSRAILIVDIGFSIRIIFSALLKALQWFHRLPKLGFLMDFGTGVLREGPCGLSTDVKGTGGPFLQPIVGASTITTNMGHSS